MFELSIKCSKDVRRITIDFGDDSQSVTESIEAPNKFPAFPALFEESPTTVVSKPDTSEDDRLDRLSNIPPTTRTAKTKKTEVSIPTANIDDRPALVDDSFKDSF